MWISDPEDYENQNKPSSIVLLIIFAAFLFSIVCVAAFVFLSRQPNTYVVASMGDSTAHLRIRTLFEANDQGLPILTPIPLSVEKEVRRVFFVLIVEENNSPTIFFAFSEGFGQMPETHYDFTGLPLLYMKNGQLVGGTVISSSGYQQDVARLVNGQLSEHSFAPQYDPHINEFFGVALCSQAGKMETCKIRPHARLTSQKILIDDKGQHWLIIDPISLSQALETPIQYMPITQEEASHLNLRIEQFGRCIDQRCNNSSYLCTSDSDCQ